MALSFRIIKILAALTPAWFKASKAIPLAIEASPITAICCFSVSPFKEEAIAIPSAAEIEVEECPTPNVSYSLSPLFGNPEIPSSCLLV